MAAFYVEDTVDKWASKVRRSRKQLNRKVQGCVASLASRFALPDVGPPRRRRQVRHKRPKQSYIHRAIKLHGRVPLYRDPKTGDIRMPHEEEPDLPDDPGDDDDVSVATADSYSSASSFEAPREPPDPAPPDPAPDPEPPDVFYFEAPCLSTSEVAYHQRRCTTAMPAFMSSDDDDQAVAFQSTFDTDSRPLRVDNCASASISGYKSDFIGDLKPLPGVKIKQLTGHAANVMLGTIRWKIQADDGSEHEIRLPNSYFVEGVETRLLSPQHWAQVKQDNVPQRHGTRCITNGDEVILEWNQRKHKRTIPLDKATGNVGVLHTAPGSQAYCTFIGEAGVDFDAPLETLSSEVLKVPVGMASSTEDDDEVFWTDDVPDGVFNHQGPPSTNDGDELLLDEDNESMDDATAEFLRIHYRLGHLPMGKIKIMAKQGLVSKRLAKCDIPVCPACFYGKATRRPWRSKPSTKDLPSGEIPQVNKPGDCISVDQLESSTPGFIAQLKGNLTKHRYKAATIFVDHKSGLGYVHLQQSTTGHETLQAKEAFEAYAAKHGVKVRHYHGDNGRFAENLFMGSILEKGQTISFCGVGAHHMNGRAERRIRELQDSARTMLIHAEARWPTAITTALWPYAVRMACDVYNATPTLGDKQALTPYERFSGIMVAHNIKHFKTFGCPVYVLDKGMQGGGLIKKWDKRARVGLYLGHSLHHARTVGLILNLETGLVSPQFHCQYDTRFQTVRSKLGNQQPSSKWQVKAGFALSPQLRPLRKVMFDDQATPVPSERAPSAPEGENAPPAAPPDSNLPSNDDAPLPPDDPIPEDDVNT